MLLDNFVFLNVKFDKYHYTDHRVGSPYYYLAYMKKGSARIVSGQNSIQVEEGDVFFIPKNLPYESYWWGEDEIDFLSYGFLSLQTEEKLNYKLQKIACDKALLQDILNIMGDNRSVSSVALSRFYSVMARLFGIMEKDGGRDEALVDMIKRRIKECPTDTLPIIAKSCAISEPYMYALFKRATGTTPNEYRQRVVCDRAVELLLTTDKKVEDIALMTGFSSASYMRRVLKKYTGLTPAEIRINQ